MRVGLSTRPVIGFFDERFFLVAEARRRFEAVGELRAISDLGDAAECEVLCAFHDAPIERDGIEAAAKGQMIIHNGWAILCQLRAAAEPGVLVVPFPGYNSRSVAEHAVGLLLDVWKGLTRSDRAVRSDDPWHVASPELLTAEVFDKTLGLVGFGHVAHHVGRIARDGFGMKVQVWSRRREPVADAGFDWTPDLDRLLASSDAVSIHLALNDETQGLLDAGRIECLKAGALVINTARAALVDCDAL